MKRTYPTAAEIVVALYCAFQTRDLFRAWAGIAPLEDYGWLAMAIWALPLLLFWTVQPAWLQQQQSTNPVLTILGLSVSLLGTLGSLNALHHAGLAFALAGLLPPSWLLLFWIPFAISWTPTLGWIGSRLFPENLVTIRLVLATVGAVWAIVILYLPKAKRANHETQ